MKRIILFLGFLISLSATAQQIKFSGFQSKSTLTGTGYIVGYEGPNNIRIPFTAITSNTTDAIAAERTATGVYTGKTFNGTNNTFLNIPQSAVTNVAADIAARVTLQQLRDSLNAVDANRKLVFVNLGVGGYGLIEAASSDTVKVLSLIGSPSVTITRVGNNLQFTATATGTTFDLAANHTWTGTNTFNNTVTVNADFAIGGAPLRIWGVPTTPFGGVTRSVFGDAANRFEYSAGNPMDGEFYHGIILRSDPFAAGPAVRAVSGEPSKPAATFQAAASQSTWIYNWTNSSGTVLGGVNQNGDLIEKPYPVYADNAAATAAGLGVNRKYRTSDGTLKVVY